ncbi:MAG: hypothetical protein K8S55_00875 [Phycisphaerae bacterium]|nr:hypothetical protein [Phycisphaerae bacterium]
MNTFAIVLFVAVLVGIFRPGYVKKRRAFGLAVIFIVAVVIAETTGVANSALYFQILTQHSEYVGSYSPDVGLFRFLAIGMIVLKIAAIISLLIAYWPGGDLFNITGQSAETEEQNAQDS